MCEPEEDGGNQHHCPSLESYTHEDGHGEPAVEKLFAKSCGNREREKGKEFRGGLGQDWFGEGLQKARGFTWKFPYAPQIQPLNGRDPQGADDRGEKNPASVVNCQTKLGGRKTVRPRPPSHHRDREPLKSNGGGVERKPLRSADVRHGQQLFRPHSSTPRQNHAEHQKDEPEVPRHPRMRTLSLSVAQVTRVPTACQFPTALQRAHWNAQASLESGIQFRGQWTRIFASNAIPLCPTLPAIPPPPYNHTQIHTLPTPPTTPTNP